MTELTRYEIVVQRNGDFIDTFSGDRGKRALAYLSKFCLENNDTFVAGDTHKSSYNQGARRVMLEIRRWLDMDISKLEKEDENE